MCFCDVFILIAYDPLEDGVDGTVQSQQALDAVTQHVCAVKMPCWMAPLHGAAAVRDCSV